MNTVKNLKIAYSKIFSNIEKQPDWAVKKIKRGCREQLIHPSIPFVGKNYDETKILLYASAENLRGYGGYLDNDVDAIDRHRLYFEKSISKDIFFPDVHIEPMNSGALVNVIGYVSKKLCPSFDFNTPRQLLEGVAFANFGKFSIEVKNRENNIDYAKSSEKLLESNKYIKADLDILKPNILIIPYKIYEHNEIKLLIQNHCPKIKVLPIYQIHHFTIDHKDRVKSYPKMGKDKLGILSEWHTKLFKGSKGDRKENFYSFYSYLDTML